MRASAIDDADDIETSEVEPQETAQSATETAESAPSGDGVGGAIPENVDQLDAGVTFGTGSLIIEGGVLTPGVDANQVDDGRGQGVKAELGEQSADEPAVELVTADGEAEPAPECVAGDSGSLSVLEAAELDADREAFEEALLAAVVGASGPKDADEPKAASVNKDPEAKTSLRGVPVKAVKQPAMQVASVQVTAMQDFDQGAVDALWDTIVIIEDAADAALDALQGNDDAPECSPFECFTERIEDVRFGHLSGEADGAFHEYITTVAGVGAFAGIAGGGAAGTIDLDVTAETVSGDGLGPRPSYDALPQFDYCRSVDTGLIEVLQDGYLPEFGWGTSIGEEFDLDGARQRNLETIRTRLQGKPPVIETIPPTERGFTYVNLPMWLWLIDPITNAETEAVSAEQTARLSTRATLIDVTWTVGDTTITCTPEDMREFVHDTNSITETAPPCHHQFDKVQSYSMTASARYFIEEQQAFRGYRDNPWPEAPWEPHPDPDAQYVTVTSATGPFEVHEILSLNISPDVTNEQAAARYQNAQTGTGSLDDFNSNAEKLLSDN